MDTTIMIKGGAKLALGVSMWGVIMALESMNVLPKDTYGMVTKYMGLAAGALYATAGALTLINGSD